MNASETKPFDLGVWLINSPWFFAALFCGFGLLLVGAFSPKYNQRQAKLEQNYQGRSLAKSQEDAKAKRISEGYLGESLAEESLSTEAISIRYSTPDNKMISLSPLIAVFGLVLLVSLAVLLKQYLEQRAARSPDPTADDSSTRFDEKIVT